MQDEHCWTSARRMRNDAAWRVSRRRLPSDSNNIFFLGLSSSYASEVRDAASGARPFGGSFMIPVPACGCALSEAHTGHSDGLQRASVFSRKEAESSSACTVTSSSLRRCASNSSPSRPSRACS